MLIPTPRPTPLDVVPGRASIAMSGRLVLANSLNLALPLAMLAGANVVSDVVDAREWDSFWIRWVANGAGVALRIQYVDPVDETTVMDTFDPAVATAGAANDARMTYELGMLAAYLNTAALYALAPAPLEFFKFQFVNTAGVGRSVTAISTVIFKS